MTIGYLTLGQFLLLCGFTFGLLAVVVLMIAGSAKPKPEPTVENEQDATREVAAHGFQWNGVTSQGDDCEIPFMLDSVEDRDDFLRRHLGTKPAA